MKDEGWNSLLKSKLKVALTKVEEKAAELEKLWSSWNVTKESCNTKMASVVGYVAMGAISVSNMMKLHFQLIER